MPIWYCTRLVSFVLFGSGSEHTYQTLCEGLELIIGLKVLLFVDAYKNGSTSNQGQPVLILTPQARDPVPCSISNIQDRVVSVKQLIVREDMFSGEADLLQISLQSEIQHREEGLYGGSV